MPDYRALIDLIHNPEHHFIEHDEYVDCLMIDFAHDRPHVMHYLDRHLALMVDTETGEVIGFYIENISYSRKD